MNRAADNEIRSIGRFLLVLFVVLMVVLAALAYLVRYDVDLNAVYDNAEGGFYLTDEYGNEQYVTSADAMNVPAGGSVRLDAGSNARVEIMDGSAAYAYLTGPLTWMLTLAERHATAYEHIASADEGTYHVIIEQSGGTVVYDFSQADPPLQEMNLVLRFSDGEFTPDTPCFQAFAPTDSAPSRVAVIPCEGEIQPTPTLPPVP